MAPSPKSRRLVSLDALRGFDMFWIMGGDFLIHLLAAATGLSGLALMSDQLHHAQWQGFHAYDLVFPLFMFLSGISLVLSLEKTKDDRLKFLTKASRRAAILVILGIIYNFGWSLDPERFRVASVLGQIGVAYLIAAFTFVLLKEWYLRLTVVCIILAIVATLQILLPVPGIGAGVFTPEGIVNGWIDRLFLPGRLYGGPYDPEGILSVFSSSSVTIMGGLVGGFLTKHKDLRRLGLLSIMAGLLIIIGVVLDPYYPIIKAAWTAPFDLIAAGISMLLFILFYLVIDIFNYTRWALFFSVIGMNSIAIYLGVRFISYPLLKLTNDGNIFAQPSIAIPLVIAVIAAEWVALRACFNRGWFLKI